ncbi:uncharacterized protein LOC131670578 [Phymastichus coffea]|uniref:uncharacterized protein LOC131670578 n=1 Tax=Phymastichus coffea TaxID=108790 RepID=UPI00273CA80B|nr:uncharacterized protein LOC131670578 [Phymastichus coffea]
MNVLEEKSYLSVDNDWTLPMTKDFIKALMTATLCNDIQELKNHTIIDCVWRKVGEDLKIDPSSLKNFWYYRLHMQLFCTEPIYFNDIKIKLIEYLYEKGISNKKDIKWQNVLLYFEGYTQLFLYRIFTYLIRTTKESTDFTNLAAIINHLYVHQIPNIIQNVNDKILPRLIYEDGNIKHLDIDVKEWMSLQNRRSEHSDLSSSEE